MSPAGDASTKHSVMADPTGEVQDAWVAKEYVRDIYLTDDRDTAEAALDRAIAWCTDPISGRELRTVAKTRESQCGDAKQHS